MSVDLATLAIRVDATEAWQAAVELEKLKQAGLGAGKAADGLASKTAMFSAAAVTATLAVVAFARSQINAADAMNDMHLRTGLAFKDLAAYDLLARQSGTSIGGMAIGFKFLGKYIIDNGDKLRALGVTATDSSGAMSQFADVIVGIKDPMLRTALAQEVLGRGAMELMPALMGGSKAMDEARVASEKLGAAYEKTSPHADKFNDNLDEIGTHVGELGQSFANLFLPQLADVAEAMAKASREGGVLNGSLVGLGALFANVFGMDITKSPLQLLHEQAGELREEMGDLLKMKVGYVALHWTDEKEVERLGKISVINEKLLGLSKEINKIETAGAANTPAAKGGTDDRARNMLGGDDAGKAAGKAAAEKEKFIEQMQRESDQYGLTAGQIKVQEAAMAGLSITQQEAVRILADELDARTALEKVTAADLAESEKAKAAALALNQSSLDYIATLKRQTNELGKTSNELVILAASYKAALDPANAEAIMAEADAFNQRREVVDANAKATDDLTTANEKAANDSAAAWERFDASVQRTLGDSLMMAMQNNFKGIANMFKQMLLRMAADAAAARITVAIMGSVGTAGIANAAGQTVGATASSGLAGMIGSPALAASGAAAAMGPTIGTAATGMGGIGAAMASPAVVAAAVVLGALAIAKFGFGIGNKYEAKGGNKLVGEFTSEGFEGDRRQTMKKEGGWFKSDKTRIDKTAISGAESQALQHMVAGLEGAFGALGDAIGDTSVRTNDWTVKMNKAGNVTGALADGMGAQLIPGLEAFKLKGEHLANTAVRLTGVFVTTTQFTAMMGVSVSDAFGSIGLSSTTARQALIDAAGGIDAFVSKSTYFAQNFLTEAQQLVPAQDAVVDTFHRLNMVVPASKDAFAALMAAATAAGDSQLVATLLDIAPAFNAVATAAAQASAVMQSIMSGLASRQRDLGVDLLASTGDSAGALALGRSNEVADATKDKTAAEVAQITSSYNTIFATEDLITANNAAAAAAQQAAQDAQQAADRQAQAAKTLKDAWQSVTNTIFEEVRRIRGLLGQNTAGNAQTAFDAATAKARAGDQDAAKLLPALSQALLTIAESTATTAEELARARGRVAGSLETTGNMLTSQFGLTPQSGAQTQPLIVQQSIRSPANDPLIGEIRMLRKEVVGLRAETQAVAGHTAGTKRLLDRAMPDGDALSTRVAA